MEYHIPAMVQETLIGLHIKENGIYVDATFGGGGHSKAILQKLGAKGRLIAFDQDDHALQNKPDDERLLFVPSNFRYTKRFLRFYDIPKVDGILADLGVSSYQLDRPERGFAFKHADPSLPLDMRMNNFQTTTAADIINQSDSTFLQKIFLEYGEIWNADKLVLHIRERKKKGPVTTVSQFCSILQEVAVGPVAQYMAKAFQALRITVNDELGALRQLLGDAAEIVAPGGRLVIISYHSLEDRMVKHLIQFGNVEGMIDQDIYGNKKKQWSAINKKVMMPTEEEMRENYRVRSARLRIAEKSA